MKTAEIPGFMVSGLAVVAGAFVSHWHPDWAPWVLGLVGCLTHHTGKEVGKGTL